MGKIWLKVAVLWSLGFGALEAAYFTRGNGALPAGAAHVWLMIFFCLLYATMALPPGLAAAWIGRRRTAVSERLVVLVPAWVLVSALVISQYMEWMSIAPGDFKDLVTVIIPVVLLVLVLLALDRLSAGREKGLVRVLLILPVVLLLVGSISLWNARRGGTSPDDAVNMAVATDTGLKILMVGLDGGDWKIIDPMVKDGRLPAFASLIERGVTADLKTVVPTASPSLWTSIASGKPLEEHGIHDHVRTRLPWGFPVVAKAPTRISSLTKPIKHTFRLIDKTRGLGKLYATVGNVAVRRIWEILEDYGFPSIVLRWYVTYPAQTEIGIISSDLLYASEFGGVSRLVAPDRLQEPFKNAMPLADGELDEHLFSLFDTTGLDGAGRENMRTSAPTLFQTISGQIGGDLTTRKLSRLAFAELADWRFAALYYRAMDVSHHMAWQYKDLPGEDLDAHPERRYRTVVERYYEFSDELLGEALEQADENTVVIVLSDHGFENVRFGHDRAPDGFFIMAGGPTAASSQREAIHIYDIAPTVLALLGTPVGEDMHGQAAQHLISPDFFTEFPLNTVATHEKGEEKTAEETFQEMDEETLQELKALGYL